MSISEKLSKPAPARLLFRSEWFNKVRTLVETQKADWFILSALIRPSRTGYLHRPL